MRYEMQNYVKFTKKTNPNVGANKNIMMIGNVNVS